MWTWVFGSKGLFNDLPDGNYGVQGVPAIENLPPARFSPGLLKDSSGNVWVFGGRGRKKFPQQVRNLLNDLWKFNGSHWTWIGGKDYDFGTIGVKNCSSYPPGRVSPAVWMDSSNFWVFGGLQDFDGMGKVESYGYGNDMWRFDGIYWTWMFGSRNKGDTGYYGVKGVASPLNVPPARGESPCYWTDSKNRFWLYGGARHNLLNSTLPPFSFSDLWMFNGTFWTWIAGSNTSGVEAIGIIGNQAKHFTPGFRYQANSFIDWNDNLWIYGGISSNNQDSALWRWDGSEWNWVSGNTLGIEGSPPGRVSASVAFDWSANTLWIFGGFPRSDLWSVKIIGLTNQTINLSRAIANIDYERRFYCPLDVISYLNPVSVSSSFVRQGVNETNFFGNYEVKGVPSQSAFPSGRSNAEAWYDRNNTLWIWGGYNIWPNVQNDLWKYDGKNWTWVAGSSPNGNISIDSPPPRFGATLSLDSAGNAWIFGGQSGDQILSDLWAFNGTGWIMVLNNRIMNHGIKGIANCSYHPGPRVNAASWIDSEDNFYIFGGKYDNLSPLVMNDLWKFDGTYWIWLSGSSTSNDIGRFGVKGVLSSENVPPARSGHSSCSDTNYNFWLFGGERISNYFNDLWKWNGNWTWVGGSQSLNDSGVNGVKGRKSEWYYPSGRTNSVMWSDSSNNIWIFGGYSNVGFHNDLWMFDQQQWSWIAGPETYEYPTVRAGSAAAYNPRKNEFVIVGGGISYLSYGDIWFGNITSISASLERPIGIGLLSKFSPICSSFGEVISTTDQISTLGTTTLQIITSESATSGLFTSGTQTTSGGSVSYITISVLSNPIIPRLFIFLK